MPTAPSDNVFAMILAGDIPSHEVYSDEHVYCFLDIYPQAPGHTLVVPRNYSRNVIEADSEDLAQCMKAVRKLLPAVRAATDARGVTVITNTGKEAGQMIEYLHFHVIPRKPGDRVNLYELGPEQSTQSLADMAIEIRKHIK